MRFEKKKSNLKKLFLLNSIYLFSYSTDRMAQPVRGKKSVYLHRAPHPETYVEENGAQCDLCQEHIDAGMHISGKKLDVCSQCWSEFQTAFSRTRLTDKERMLFNALLSPPYSLLRFGRDPRGSDSGVISRMPSAFREASTTSSSQLCTMMGNAFRFGSGRDLSPPSSFSEAKSLTTTNMPSTFTFGDTGNPFLSSSNSSTSPKRNTKMLSSFRTSKKTPPMTDK